MWLVDPPATSVLVFRREGGVGFAHVVEVGVDETLTSPLLPGFMLDVEALFADLE